MSGFIFRFEGSHEAEFVELHGLKVVKYHLDSCEGGVLVGLDSNTLAFTHKSGVEVCHLLTLFGSETFGLLIVYTLSDIVNGLEPNLKVVELSIAVFVAVDRGGRESAELPGRGWNHLGSAKEVCDPLGGRSGVQRCARF